MPSANQTERVEVERLRFAEIRRQRERDVEAYVEAIRTSRSDLAAKLVELQGHCDRLQRATRLARVDGGEDARYRLYHAAQTRMVGAMSQAIKRAQATDRLLEASRAEQQERERQEREDVTRANVKAAAREVLNLQLPREDDFEQLFGEVTSDAT